MGYIYFAINDSMPDLVKIGKPELKKKNEEATKNKKKAIFDSPFFGIWKNRKEMEDSIEWVRKVRKSQWTKSRS